MRTEPNPADRPLASTAAWTAERLAERRGEARRPAEAPLLWVALAVAAGALSEPLFAGLGLGPIGLIATATVLLTGWLISWRLQRDRLAAFLLLTAVGGVAGGWSACAWRWFPTDDLGRFAERDAGPVCFEAVATGRPTRYPAEPPSPFRAIPSSERSVVSVEVTRLRDGVVWRPAAGQCEITVQGDRSMIAAGDRLRVFGQLRRPTPALNPGQRDAARRDRAGRQLCVVWAEAPQCVRIEGQGDMGGAALARGAGRINAAVARAFNRHLPDGHATTVRAMLLGDLGGLPRETIEAFRRTGTLHLLVVSGLHVGLVAGVILFAAALGLVPMRVALVAAIVSVVVYAAATGGRPPAVRAAVVVVAACVATLAGRRPIAMNSLAGAAIAVFAATPGAWQAAGTRLSFLAAATLLGVAFWAGSQHSKPRPAIDRLIDTYRTPPSRLARRAAGWAGWLLAATAAVMVAAGPLLASEFHLLSPAALPLSLLTTPLVGVTVAAGLVMVVIEGMAAGLGALAGQPLADALTGSIGWSAAWVCGGAANGLAAMVSRSASLPGAGFYTAGPAPWWAMAWIGWLGIGAATETYWRERRGLFWRLGLGLLVAGVAPGLFRFATERAELRCSFIAVGHGSAVLIEPPGGGALLYDAGALGIPERAADTIARGLWAHGVRRLDGVFLSHADVDHYNALPGLIERFAIAGVWTSHRMFPRADDAADRSGPAAMRRLLKEHGVPIHALRAGDRLSSHGVSFDIMHPDDIGVIGSDNANSLVLGVEYAGRRVLLTGDLESPGLDWLLAEPPRHYDVLAAPHHGSNRSDPPGLAAWSTPELVVVSSGATNEVTGDAYRIRGASVENTHTAGQVTVRLTQKEVDWWSFLGRVGGP